MWSTTAGTGSWRRSWTSSTCSSRRRVDHPSLSGTRSALSHVAYRRIHRGTPPSRVRSSHGAVTMVSGAGRHGPSYGNWSGRNGEDRQPHPRPDPCKRRHPLHCENDLRTNCDHRRHSGTARLRQHSSKRSTGRYWVNWRSSRSDLPRTKSKTPICGNASWTYACYRTFMRFFISPAYSKPFETLRTRCTSRLVNTKTSLTHRR
jgi:hypothetical protein